MSPRRLMVLIRGLPATSLTKRAIDPDSAVHAEWGAGEYLLADIFDAIRVGYAKNPPPHDRPGDILARANSRRTVHDQLDALDALERSRNV